MRVGIITGSGTYALPELQAGEPEDVETEWGTTRITRGTFAGADVVHVSRHGEGHVRLSNHVTHRANVAALRPRTATPCWPSPSAARSTRPSSSGRWSSSTTCTSSPTGSPTARCARSTTRRATSAARTGSTRTPTRRRCAPRCSPARPRPACRPATAAATATSTARASTPRPRSAGSPPAASPPSRRPPGPETVLCGEAELPFGLVGYATDYANGVQPRPTPVETLLELIAAQHRDLRGGAGGGRPAHRARRPGAGGDQLPLPRPLTRALLTACGDLGRRVFAGSAPSAAGQALEAALLDRARAWAAAVAPGSDAPSSARAACSAAARAAFEAGGGPLLLPPSRRRACPRRTRAWRSTTSPRAPTRASGPAWTAAGTSSALARPHDALLALLDEAIDGPDVMGRTLVRRHRGGSRGRACCGWSGCFAGQGTRSRLGADPLTPADIRSALRRSG